MIWVSSNLYLIFRSPESLRLLRSACLLAGSVHLSTLEHFQIQLGQFFPSKFGIQHTQDKKNRNCKICDPWRLWGRAKSSEKMQKSSSPLNILQTNRVHGDANKCSCTANVIKKSMHTPKNLILIAHLVTVKFRLYSFHFSSKSYLVKVDTAVCYY